MCFLIRFLILTFLMIIVFFITWSIFMYWFFGTNFTENYIEDIKGFLKYAIMASISSGLIATIASHKVQQKKGNKS